MPDHFLLLLFNAVFYFEILPFDSSSVSNAFTLATPVSLVKLNPKV